MQTITLLLSTVFAVPQAVEAPTVTPAVAAAKIGVALKEAASPAIGAIESFGLIADAQVAKALGKALHHKDAEVRAAALQALRYNTDKSAFRELFRIRKQKNVVEDLVLGPEYFLALGQHRDLKALPLLTTQLRAIRRRDLVLRARLLALGRMRTRASIEALIKYSKIGRRGGSYRNEVRVALAALTGRDLGKSPVLWNQWWSDNRKHYQVSQHEKALPDRLAKTWTRVWQLPGKGKKRNSGKDTAGKDPAGKTGEGSGGDKKKRRRKRRKKNA